MRTYESIFIVHPEVVGDDQTAIIEKYKTILTDQGAEIIKVDNWGVKTLAYPVKKQSKGWQYSVVLLAGLTIMAFYGLIGGTGVHPRFQWMFVNMVSPLQSTMFALLSFYVASAAYRAFRARNFEATILLIAAIIVMMGRIPFGDMLTGGRMTPLSEWIMSIPNAAAQRGIIIGAALGAASMSIRIILGIERTYLGTGKD